MGEEGLIGDRMHPIEIKCKAIIKSLLVLFTSQPDAAKSQNASDKAALRRI